MEQHFPDMAQKVRQDNTLDSFADHFAKYFTEKLTPQKCIGIVSFRIISMLNTIGSMKIWG